MCDIWRKDGADEVEPSFYYHLPRILREINITGGEPFLRDDLPLIVSIILERAPRARIVISSNGLLTNRIREMLPEMMRASRRLGLRISIDGATAEMHDKLRGVPGAFDKAWATLEAVRGLGLRDLGLGFTMSRGNEQDLLPLYERARKMGLQFTSTIAHSSPVFFGDQEDATPDAGQAATIYQELRRRQLHSWHPKEWYRAYFTAGVVDLVRDQRRHIVCPALSAFFFLDPYGVVYPCHIKNWPLGVLDQGYEKLAAQHPQIPQQVAACREHCWMTCTVAPLMRRDFWAITGTVLWDRLRAMAGKS